MIPIAHPVSKGPPHADDAAGCNNLVPKAPTAQLEDAAGCNTLVPKAPAAQLGDAAGCNTLVPKAPAAQLEDAAGCNTLVPKAPAAQLEDAAGCNTLVPKAPAAQPEDATGCNTLVPKAPAARLPVNDETLLTPWLGRRGEVPTGTSDWRLWGSGAKRGCRPLQAAALGERMHRWAGLVTRDVPPVEEFAQLAELALDTADLALGEEAAIDWAGDFKWPQTLRDRDIREFEDCRFDLACLVRHRLEALPYERLSEDRVRNTLRKDNPHREKMLEVARGVTVHHAEDFVPNGQMQSLPRLTRSYEKMAAAVDKAFFLTHGETNMAVVLPLELVRKHVPMFHVSALGWTEKAGKVCGRPLTDATRRTEGYSALNSDEGTEACRNQWGPINHPSIADIACMILEAVRRFPGEELRLWKDDVARAYTQLVFAAEDVRLMSGQMANGDVIFFVGGIFGWAGMPFPFNVVTQAIRWELERRLKGPSDIYVDDSYGCGTDGPKAPAGADAKAAAELIGQLLGPTAVVPPGLSGCKGESGQCLDLIGYSVDVWLGLVGIARKNILRALEGFFCVERNQPVSVRQLQRLASWASRYAGICVFLRPFSVSLYAAMRGRVFLDALIDWTPRTWASVQLFRAVLALSVLRRHEFTRTIESFAPVQSRSARSIIIEGDACLTGIGVLIYGWQPGDRWVPVGGTAHISLERYGWDRSDFQNTAEFIGLLCGVVAAVRMGKSLSDVTFRGDSTTALEWIGSQRARSETAMNASVLFVLLAIRVGLVTSQVVWIDTNENWRCDDLSRGGPWKGLQEKDTAWKEVESTPVDWDEMLQLCNPVLEWGDDAGIWRRAHAWIDSIVSAQTLPQL